MVTPLRQARKDAGLTVAELAQEIETTTQAIYQLEEGRRKGSIETWIKLANALNTSVDALTMNLLEPATSGKA